MLDGLVTGSFIVILGFSWEDRVCWCHIYALSLKGLLTLCPICYCATNKKKNTLYSVKNKK